MHDTVTARFNEIYDATYTSVVKLVASKCGNVSDIGDLVQDTYMELYQTLCRHGEGYARNAKGLTLRIAKRKVAKFYAKAARQDVVSIDDAQSYTEQDAVGYEDFTVNAMMAEQARTILRQKPDDVQTIFALFYDVELSIADIAKTLGMSQSNVKNKLYRTLKELRAAMEGEPT